MKPISFIEIKTFLVNTIREYSIDDFYLKRHPYYIFDNFLAPQLDTDKIISTLSKKFPFNWIYIDRRFLISLFPEIEKEDTNMSYKEKDDLLSLENKYFTSNELLEIIQKKRNKYPTKEIQSKILTYANDFETSLKYNIEGIYDYNKKIIKQINLFEKIIADLESQIQKKLNKQDILLSNENQLIENLKQTQKSIYNLPVEEKENQQKISEIELEISTLSSSQVNEKINKKILSFQKNKLKIQLDFQNKKNNLTEELSNLKTQKNEIFNLMEQNKIDRAQLKKSLNNEISKKETFISENIIFDLVQEEKAYQLLAFVLFQKRTNDSFLNEYSYLSNDNKKHSYHFLDLFWESYNQYNTIGNLDWKADLINILTNEIVEPYIFHSFYEKEEKKPKYAQISYEIKITNTEIIKVNIDDVFPVFYTLKNALENNTLFKSNTNVFYLSLNNGIYAKFQIRKNKTINDELIIAFNYKNGFSKHTAIFSGYSYAGFLLNEGLYINYKKWAVEIEFEANALLLQNFNLSQQFQNTSYEAIEDEKRRKEEEWD